MNKLLTILKPHNHVHYQRSMLPNPPIVVESNNSAVVFESLGERMSVG